MATVRSVAYGGANPTPPPEVVHAIHERYLIEVVEGLGLCPFARHSRAAGRVHRPVLWVDKDGPTAEHTAQGLLAAVRGPQPPEIVLLTFVDNTSRFADSAQFDAFVAQVREAYSATCEHRYFMVGFHPGLGSLPFGESPSEVTRDSLVPLIRRSPDPVIQCVHGPTLERVRRQAQDAAHRRMLEAADKTDPVLRALLEQSVQADSQLSADIAEANFTAVGTGSGRLELERVLADIQRERDEAYGFREHREPNS